MQMGETVLTFDAVDTCVRNQKLAPANIINLSNLLHIASIQIQFQSQQRYPDFNEILVYIIYRLIYETRMTVEVVVQYVQGLLLTGVRSTSFTVECLFICKRFFRKIIILAIFACSCESKLDVSRNSSS